MELFDCAAEKLEALTDFDRLEARGTLRIALKEAGLEAAHLTLPQLEAVFDKVMPPQLEQRAVGDTQAVCVAVIKEIRLAGNAGDAQATTSSDEILASGMLASVCAID